MEYFNLLASGVRSCRHCCQCLGYIRKRILHRERWFNQPFRTTKRNFFAGDKCLQNARINEANARINEANIQMIPENLRTQIFKSDKNFYEQSTLRKVHEHLHAHNLWRNPPALHDTVDVKLDLQGDNIAEHFEIIGENVYKSYYNLAEVMSSVTTKTPKPPDKWQFTPGWTKYCSDGSVTPVAVPDEEILVFDVEVSVPTGGIPVLATALSADAWYCWVSSCLFEEEEFPIPDNVALESLIPLEGHPDKKMLVIGHNVAYDRSYVKDQYTLRCSETRFLDTMSLHMCVSGLTNEQRNTMNAKEPTWYEWMDHGAANSLEKVYRFYCGKKLDKSTRDFFVKGSLDEIKANFQECVKYCASDVKSTKEVFQTQWPMFKEHAPHIITFGGMLEMGTAYLPINDRWQSYVSNCEKIYEETTSRLKKSLMKVADEALKFLVEEKYKADPWLSNLDWSLHKCCETDSKPEYDGNEDIHTYIEKTTNHLSEARKKNLNLPGYPRWYRDLCRTRTDPLYVPGAGPVKISTMTKSTPTLLRMTWNGYPLHYKKEYKWGYLVPSVDLEGENGNNKSEGIDIGIKSKTFFKIHHKDGENFEVMNPLGKTFIPKLSDGTLKSNGSYNSTEAMEINKSLSFWRGNRKRVSNQLAAWFKDEGHGAILPRVISAGTVTRRAVEPTWLTASNPKKDRLGSEMKSNIVAPEGYYLVGADVDSQELWIASVLGDAYFSKVHGATAFGWMTLQGRKTDGTDMHSKTADTVGSNRDQAKIFNYSRIYGAGAGFARRILMEFDPNLTENEAENKVTRLYNATKGSRKYLLTNLGRKVAKDLGTKVADDGLISYDQFKRILNKTGVPWERREQLVHFDRQWSGGTESEMFNNLESIAFSDYPRTPVLDCLITTALNPKYVGTKYVTSRINWVVQSSAVDYLHLLLTCMKWLIKKHHINARFCISVHDELRYIVSEEDKYRAALALQISNLLTRAMFSYQLGMYDLPYSVAFFSQVDIDKVWRKEVDLDCATPSNPEGLKKGHGIEVGEAIDIDTLLKKMNVDTLQLQNGGI